MISEELCDPGSCWNDNTQARLAEVRDRMVRVRLSEDECGINLKHATDVIDKVAQRDGEVVDRLIARFLRPPTAGGWDGRSNQRWIRLDVLIYALNEKTGSLLKALGSDVSVPRHSSSLTANQADALKTLIAALEDMALVFGKSATHYPNQQPAPELHARSPYDRSWDFNLPIHSQSAGG